MTDELLRLYESGDIVYLEHVFFKSGKIIKEYIKGTIVAYRFISKTWFTKEHWEYLIESDQGIIKAPERLLWGSEHISAYHKILNFKNKENNAV